MKQKINKLQNENQKIREELIEAQNKIKINIDEQNTSLRNKKKENENEKKEINILKNKLNEYEKIIANLNITKKTLEAKNNDMQKEHEREINIVNLYKDKELQSKQNTINELQNKLNQNKTIIDNSSKGNPKQVLELEKKNKYLQNEIDRMNMQLKNKNDIIEKLNHKIQMFSKNYNRQVNSLQMNNNRSQSHVDQLLRERDQLLQQNTELNTGINQLNEKVKDTLMMFNQKRNEFNNVIQNYKNKLKEYKTKIILLKKKIDELHMRKNNDYDNNYYYGHKDNSVLLPKGNNDIFNKSFRKKNNMNLFTDENLNYSQRKKSIDEYRKMVENLGTK